jgi:tetratricopeptide (TPR) repeat protein
LQGNVQGNIEQAISLYNQAAEVFTQSAYPHRWFRNQAHLASAYLARADLYDTEPEQLENLNTAIALLQEVLDTADPNAPTPDYIDAQYHLGTAFRKRHDITQDAADLRAAGLAYEASLNAISPEHYDREKMWQAIPETQTILGSRLVRDGEWHKGLELLQAAAKELGPHSRKNPRAYANALYQIGRTYEIMSNWKDARIYYRDALRLYEHIDDELGMANCHQGLGAVLGCQGAFTKCIDELNAARAFYTKLGMTERIEEVDGLHRAAETGQQELDSLTWSVAR